MTDPDTTAAPTGTPEPPAEAPAVAGRAGSPRSPRWTGWIALAALLAALMAGFAWMSAERRADDAARERDDRREVASVASAFGEAYLTYDFDDVERSSAAVTELATDRFAEGFAETSAPGIEQLFASMQTSTVATTEEVFVGDVGDGRARALVVVDVDASSTASQQQLSNLSFVLDLVEEDGEWKVDAVAPAPQADISDDPAGGPTSTTAPATSPTAPATSPTEATP